MVVGEVARRASARASTRCGPGSATLLRPLGRVLAPRDPNQDRLVRFEPELLTAELAGRYCHRHQLHEKPSSTIGVNVKHTRQAGLAVVALSAVLATALVACSSPSPAAEPTSQSTPGAIDKTYAGTTISLLVPSWAAFKTGILDDFTQRTGITVKVETVAFDAIHDKIVTAEASGQAPADVIELDWTWVSQFGAAGWLEPLGSYLTADQIQGAAGSSSFSYQSKQIGLPYSLDFRGTAYNMTMLKKAGISEPPTTWAELLTAAKALKAAGVSEYPIGLPLSIQETTATPWYMLIRAAGGEVLDAQGQPAFATNGLGEKSFQFLRDMYASGVIDPGAIGLTVDQVNKAFIAGTNAIMLAAYPSVVTNNKPGVPDSNIVGDELQFVHAPGDKDNTTGGSIALEEALAIPAASTHKGAAAMYLSWQNETAQKVAAYNDPDQGVLPTTQAALKELSTNPDNGPLMASVLSLLPTVVPVIPGGPPTWYTKFSAEVASTLQSVALGQVSPADAVVALTEKTKQIVAQAK